MNDIPSIRMERYEPLRPSVHFVRYVFQIWGTELAHMIIEPAVPIISKMFVVSIFHLPA